MGGAWRLPRHLLIVRNAEDRHPVGDLPRYHRPRRRQGSHRVPKARGGGVCNPGKAAPRHGRNLCAHHARGGSVPHRHHDHQLRAGEGRRSGGEDRPHLFHRHLLGRSKRFARLRHEDLPRVFALLRKCALPLCGHRHTQPQPLQRTYPLCRLSGRNGHGAGSHPIFPT